MVSKRKILHSINLFLKKQFNDIVAVALIHGTFIFRMKNSSLGINEDKLYKLIRYLHYKTIQIKSHHDDQGVQVRAMTRV